MQPSAVRVYDIPQGIPVNDDFLLEVQSLQSGSNQPWLVAPAYATNVAHAVTDGNIFDRHSVSVATFDVDGPVNIRARYNKGSIETAIVRPGSRGIKVIVEDNTTSFTIHKPCDVMLEINGSKWNALHILINQIDDSAPTAETKDVWYFGPGINNGPAYANVTDGANLMVPSGKTVYLASGAILTCRRNFINVHDCAVRGQGVIYGPNGGYTHREWGGAIHMSKAENILVEGVTSLGANGFSLSAGECNDIHVKGYRSFSDAGNGDGIDFFCSSNIVVENCFLRNSDDTIALYSHRWSWAGDSKNIIIRNCTLLPDIAHAINIGTHGNPEHPEVISNICISNIDILDHEEHQLWYQGCIAINAADMNTIEDVQIEDVRVERITRGQLFNIRVMQNSMWTTAPGKRVRNISFKNLSLNVRDSEVVNPSQIMGFDEQRQVENIQFENLRIGEKVVWECMAKPRWFMVADFVPVFVNEHVQGLAFSKV